VNARRAGIFIHTSARPAAIGTSAPRADGLADPLGSSHRRATIWHHNGLPAKVLAERLGHSKASMSLDVYSHTLPPGDVAAKELLARIAV
jgi:integrase